MMRERLAKVQETGSQERIELELRRSSGPKARERGKQKSD